MENNLPKGWIECKLGDVCSKPQYGWTSKAGKSGRIKYLRTTDISDGSLNWDEVPFCIEEPGDIEKYQVRENDILVSRAGSVGLSFRIKGDVSFDAVFASYLIRFKSYDDATARLLEYFLQSKIYWDQISDFTAGIAIPNVNASKLEELSIPLPPLPEQQRIVEKLDALMARISNCKPRLEKIPTLLKNFRQSVLAAAVSGELTKEWREQNKDIKSSINLINESYKERQKLINKDKKKYSKLPELKADQSEEFPEKWVLTTPENIASPEKYSLAIGPFGSNLKVSDYKDSGVPLVFVRHIKANDFSGLNSKFITKEKALELEPHSIESMDLIITKMGEPPGDCEIYPKGLPKAIITADCLKFRIWDKYFHRLFLKYTINSIFVKEQLGIITLGVAQQKISLERFKSILLPIPPLEEQKEIVCKVEELFHFADSIEARYQKAKSWFDKLPQAILAKAFCGELVSQNENDESAEVLLNKIRNQKATEEEKKKERKKSTNRIRNEKNKTSKIFYDMNLVDIIKNSFQEKLFTFEELEKVLSHKSKMEYVETKKQFFTLLRNDKFKKKEARLTSELDGSGTIKYKLIQL